VSKSGSCYNQKPRSGTILNLSKSAAMTNKRMNRPDCLDVEETVVEMDVE
jgi:hypothetical protein